MCVMSLNIKLWVTNSSQKGSSFEQTCYQSSNHKISSILLLLCKIIGMNCGNVTSLETVTMSLNLWPLIRNCDNSLASCVLWSVRALIDMNIKVNIATYRRSSRLSEPRANWRLSFPHTNVGNQAKRPTSASEWGSSPGSMPSFLLNRPRFHVNSPPKK